MSDIEPNGSSDKSNSIGPLRSVIGTPRSRNSQWLLLEPVSRLLLDLNAMVV